MLDPVPIMEPEPTSSKIDLAGAGEFLLVAGGDECLGADEGHE
jgi:hypothetical protein